MASQEATDYEALAERRNAYNKGRTILDAIEWRLRNDPEEIYAWLDHNFPSVPMPSEWRTRSPARRRML